MSNGALQPPFLLCLKEEKNIPSICDGLRYMLCCPNLVLGPSEIHMLPLLLQTLTRTLLEKCTDQQHNDKMPPSSPESTLQEKKTAFHKKVFLHSSRSGHVDCHFCKKIVWAPNSMSLSCNCFQSRRLLQTQQLTSLLS